MRHTVSSSKVVAFLSSMMVLGLPGSRVAGRIVSGGPAEAEKVPAGISAADWGGIRRAYEQRHAAFAVGSEYQARNAEQQWCTQFDGRGFRVEPDSGAWSWGLQLASYGFAGHEQVVQGRAQVSASGDRVSYEWNRGLEEWYVNDGRGLEQGFTLNERPAGGGGRLALHLEAQGGLQARVEADGQGVSFGDSSGRAVVRYVGLRVWDARGGRWRRGSWGSARNWSWRWRRVGRATR